MRAHTRLMACCRLLRTRPDNPTAFHPARVRWMREQFRAQSSTLRNGFLSGWLPTKCTYKISAGDSRSLIGALVGEGGATPSKRRPRPAWPGPLFWMESLLKKEIGARALHMIPKVVVQLKIACPPLALCGQHGNMEENRIVDSGAHGQDPCEVWTGCDFHETP